VIQRQQPSARSGPDGVQPTRAETARRGVCLRCDNGGGGQAAHRGSCTRRDSLARRASAASAASAANRVLLKQSVGSTSARIRAAAAS
jgi:hypothetical protein